MKKTIPVKELINEDTAAKIEETLKNDPENAYTISWIMVKTFGINQKDIENKSFSKWKDGQSALYARIDRHLRKMVQLGKVKCKKHERAMVYWWNQQKPTFVLKE